MDGVNRKKTKKLVPIVQVPQNRPKKSLTASQLAQPVLYFAYGSNLYKPRLEQRVGEVTVIGTHRLHGFELNFNVASNFANIQKNEDAFCEGVIYEMTYAQLRLLDLYEGLYRRDYTMYNDRKLHMYTAKKCITWEDSVFIDANYECLVRLGAMQHNLQQTLQILDRTPLIIFDKKQIYRKCFHISECEW